jgi:hypothetical protein
MYTAQSDPTCMLSYEAEMCMRGRIWPIRLRGAYIFSAFLLEGRTHLIAREIVALWSFSKTIGDA